MAAGFKHHLDDAETGLRIFPIERWGRPNSATVYARGCVFHSQTYLTEGEPGMPSHAADGIADVIADAWELMTYGGVRVTIPHVYLKCTSSPCQACLGRGYRDGTADDPEATECGSCGGRGLTHCGGCHGDGLDCRHETLSICSVCWGAEGSLLPSCPGRKLTIAEDQHNYRQYCEGTGPFAKEPDYASV